jgi:hypothetical protein
LRYHGRLGEIWEGAILGLPRGYLICLVTSGFEPEKKKTNQCKQLVETEA